MTESWNIEGGESLRATRATPVRSIKTLFVVEAGWEF